jgi:hypothetical protein
MLGREDECCELVYSYTKVIADGKSIIIMVNRENNEVCNCLDASALGLHNSYFLLKAMVYNPQSNN